MVWLFGKKKSTQSKLKSIRPPTRKEKLLKLTQSKDYYSVSITRAGCPASCQLIGRTFLFQDVPALPLPNCKADKCTCEYLGVLNRRKKERRQRERRKSLRMEEDRRQRGRRKGEELWSCYSI
jgi:hypothetical protein